MRPERGPVRPKQRSRHRQVCSGAGTREATDQFPASLVSQEAFPTLSNRKFCTENMQILLITGEMRTVPPLMSLQIVLHSLR